MLPHGLAETYPPVYLENGNGFVLYGVNALDILLTRCTWTQFSWEQKSFWRALALDQTATVSVSTGPSQTIPALISVLEQPEIPEDHRYLIWTPENMQVHLGALINATLQDVPGTIQPGIGSLQISQRFKRIIETRGALQIDDVLSQLALILGYEVDAPALLLALAEVRQNPDGPLYCGRFVVELEDCNLVVRLDNLGDLVVSPDGLNIPIINWEQQLLEVTSLPTEPVLLIYQFEPKSGTVFSLDVEERVRPRVLEYREMILNWQRAKI